MNGWFILVIATVVAGTAISSKPHHSTFPEVFMASFKSAFGPTQQFADKKLTKAISDLKCTTAADGCKSMIARGLVTRYSDKILFNMAQITFDGHRVARCFGTANMWFCFDD